MFILFSATILGCLTSLVLNSVGSNFGLDTVVLVEDVVNDYMYLASTNTILLDVDTLNNVLASLNYDVLERIENISDIYFDKPEVAGVSEFTPCDLGGKLEYENQILHLIYELNIFEVLANEANLNLENYSLGQLFDLYMQVLRTVYSDIGDYEMHNLFYHFMNTDYIKGYLQDKNGLNYYNHLLTNILLNLNLWDAEQGGSSVNLSSQALVQHILDLQPYTNSEDIKRLNRLKSYVNQGEDVLAFVTYRGDVIYKALQSGIYLDPSNYNLRVLFEIFKSLTGSGLSVDEMNNFIFEETKSILKNNYEAGTAIDEDFILLLYKDYISKWMELNYKELAHFYEGDDVDVARGFSAIGLSQFWFGHVSVEDNMNPLQAHQDFLHDFQEFTAKFGGFMNVPGEKQRAFLTLVEWMRMHIDVGYYKGLEAHEEPYIRYIGSDIQLTAILNQFYAYSLEAKLITDSDIESWESMRKLLFYEFKQELLKLPAGPGFPYLLDDARLAHYMKSAKILYIYSDLIENGWNEEYLVFEVIDDVLKMYCRDSDDMYNILTPEFIKFYQQQKWAGKKEYDHDFFVDLILAEYENNEALQKVLDADNLEDSAGGLYVILAAVLNDINRFIFFNVRGQGGSWVIERDEAMYEDIFGLRVLFHEKAEGSEWRNWGKQLDDNSNPLSSQGISWNEYVDKYLSLGDAVFLDEQGDYSLTYYENDTERVCVKQFIGNKWDTEYWDMDEAMEAEIFFDKIRGAEQPVNKGITGELVEQLQVSLDRPVSELRTGSKWLRPNPLSYEFTRDSYLYESSISYYGVKIGTGFIRNDSTFVKMGDLVEDFYKQYAK